MTDELGGEEEPVILNKQTDFEKLSRIGELSHSLCLCFHSSKLPVSAKP
jgi:hypothetical protein